MAIPMAPGLYGRQTYSYPLVEHDPGTSKLLGRLETSRLYMIPTFGVYHQTQNPWLPHSPSIMAMDAACQIQERVNTLNPSLRTVPLVHPAALVGLFSYVGRRYRSLPCRWPCTASMDVVLQPTCQQIPG